MSYQVLARKWRPQKFQDVVGQQHVTRALQNAVINKKIGHAYMLVGTRGVGKTTVARLFAKAIRCEHLTADGNPCNTCKACLDFDTETSMNVIEIDGASNNSVDNIRELISNVHYLPTSGQFKVYIIDEVHMLSTNAFNALLKTLEEPPAHVVFIFATTEAQKLLGTVLSRCQRFDFRHISVSDLVGHVKEIAAAEGIKFERDELIEQIAVLGRGSARDTLSLVDQVLTMSGGGMITEEILTSSLGVAGPKSLRTILSAVYSGDVHSLGFVYNRLLSENVPAKNIAQGLLDELFNDITTNKEFSQAEIIWMYETMAKETSWIFTSIAPDKAFQVLLYKVALRRNFFTNKIQGKSEATPKVEVAEPIAVSAEPMSSVAAILKEEMEKHEQAEKLAPVKKAEPVAAPVVETKIVSPAHKEMSWEGFLTYLNSKSPASASNLEQGNITSPLRLENGELFVELGFGFSGAVFFDYLNDAEVFQKVVNHLADYFEVSASNVRLELKQVTSGENFVSQADIREQQDGINMQEKIDQFKSNPLLKEAERIFNSKVDKVIIDKK